MKLSLKNFQLELSSCSFIVVVSTFFFCALPLSWAPHSSSSSFHHILCVRNIKWLARSVASSFLLTRHISSFLLRIPTTERSKREKTSATALQVHPLLKNSFSLSSLSLSAFLNRKLGNFLSHFSLTLSELVAFFFEKIFLYNLGEERDDVVLFTYKTFKLLRRPSKFFLYFTFHSHECVFTASSAPLFLRHSTRRRHLHFPALRLFSLSHLRAKPFPLVTGLFSLLLLVEGFKVLMLVSSGNVF